ncbi:cache domain-containing protein [Arcobacteraceae bacterium]|nr:cache domain-containing protein [Arcobacteraceae bacterium]
MNLITEKNLPKMIIYIFSIIMSSMILMISYFYIEYTYKDFDIQMDRFVKEYYQDKRKTLKKEIDTIFDILNYNIVSKDINNQEFKDEAIRLLNNITFEEKKSNYFFVYDIKNINGGDKFAILLVNPNRPDLINRFISTNFKDANGKKFREEFLFNIRKTGESYTEYAYKKPNESEAKLKLSYFKYHEKLNWVVAVGVYIDDIENEILSKRQNLERNVKRQIHQNIVLFLLFLTIAIVVSIFISQEIDRVLKDYQRKVSEDAKLLEELNSTLQNRVQVEIDKNREKEQLLVEKSRFIALGEMISNIAHQWRQPLSELSAILMNIKFKHSLGTLDIDSMQKKSNEATKVLEYMSHTIDDFRNFFMPKKEKEEFLLYTIMNSVMTIISSSLENNNIKVDLKIDENIKVNTYLNEYQQVVLNIMKNAKDVLICNDIKDACITIKAYKENKSIVLTIEDNGGGIVTKPKNKIFEPYFTTKSQADGTGIGLYMSKIIIDKNMDGKLKVTNIKDGAKFWIFIPR